MTCPADHAHGDTTVCYKRHHCRCDDCRNRANSDARERYELAHGPIHEPLPCGTTAALRRHYRAGEQPCRSCRQAEARAWQDRTRKTNNRK